MKNDLKKFRFIFLCILLQILMIVLNNSFGLGTDLKKNDITSSVTTITQEELETLPVGRSLSEALNLVPGVNTIGNQTLVRGSSAYDNTFMINGVVVNDPLQRDQYLNLPFDAIQEIQVQTGGLAAEYGNSMGGVINVITKSGGNKLSGSASAYFSPGALRYDFGQEIKEKNPTVVGDYFRSSSEYGFTLGGPIIRDKLWFFGSSQLTRGSTQTLFEDDSPQDYRDFSSNLKLNYQPNIQNKFTLSYNYSNYNYDYEHSYNSSRYSSTDAFPRFSIGGSYDRICDKGWETRFQTSYSQFSRDYEKISTFGMSESQYTKDKTARSFDAHVDVLAPPFFCGDCRHQLGWGFGYQATCLDRMIESYDSHSYQYTEPGYQVTETWQYWHNYDHSAKMRNFSFYVQDTWTIGQKLTANIGFRYDRATFDWSGSTADDQEIKEKDLYSWGPISPRIGLTYDIKGDGKNVVRFNYGRYYQNNQYGYFENAHPGGSIYRDRYTIQIDGEKTVDTDNSYFYPPSSSFGYNGYQLKAPYMDQIMVGINKQLSEDWSVGLFYTKSWERNLIQTVDIGRLDWDALINEDKLVWTGYQPVDITNPYDNQTMTVYGDTNDTAIPTYTIVNPPGAKRDYNAIELILNKRYSNNWSMMASYTYSKSQGTVSTSDYEENYGHSNLYQNPNAQINTDGLFDYAFPHQIKVHGTYDGLYDIQIGGSLKIFSGNPYTHELSSAYPPLSDIPDGFGHIYAEPRGDSRLPTFWMLNLGLEKTFKITDTTTATIFVDGYNITNNSVKLKVNPVIGSSNQDEIQRILNPGLFQFGVRVSF